MSTSSGDQTKRHVEAAYRLGYVQGVAAVIAALPDNLSPVQKREIEWWFDHLLTPWSHFDGIEDKMPAPEFPDLGRIRQHTSDHEHIS